PDASLFSIGDLHIGTSRRAPSPDATRLTGWVQLVDNHKNSPAAGAEALYVSHLTLEPGATLDLAGHALYYASMTPTDPSAPGSGVKIVDSVGGGRLARLHYATARSTDQIQRP